MATLLLVLGPGAGRQFPLDGHCAVIGRQPEAAVHINLPDVSRRHAQVLAEEGQYYLEDLGSSNGTFLNRVPIRGRTPLRANDRITIGPCEFLFEEGGTEPVIRAQISADTSNIDLYRQDPATKLQAVLEIAHQLAQARDLDDLLAKVLDHLLKLFIKADRGLVLLREGERVEVRATRSRRPERTPGQVYSRVVVERVLRDGLGIVAADEGAAPGETLRAAGVQSFVCVPLKGRGGRPLGVLQLDRSGRGAEFNQDDLHLLTAVSFQVAAVVENTALHAELLEHERVKRDLALARLGQMVAGVAHEVNNPLAFVTNNAAVCQRDLGALKRLIELYRGADDALAEHRPELAAEIRTFAEEIDLDYTLKNLDELLTRSRDGLKRIQQIVQDLRDFARLDRSEYEEVDLNRGVEATVNIARGLAEKRGVSLELDLGPLPRLACQPSRLHQVVFNLVANAIDASAAGAKVIVRTRAVPGALEIHVLDTGAGIDPAVRDKIFDPFFTTKPLGQGAGLGLSISHGIVQDHGGTIEVDSEPGRGSHFLVRLPLAAEERNTERG